MTITALSIVLKIQREGFSL